MALRMKDCWELIFDYRHVPIVFGQFREDVFCNAACLLSLKTFESALTQDRVFDIGNEFIRTDGFIPDPKRSLLAKLSHGFAISPHAGCNHVFTDGIAQPVVSTGDKKASCQPLDIPLPGCRKRLVQIVHRENDSSLWSRESAKVTQVGIPATLHTNSGRGR